MQSQVTGSPQPQTLDCCRPSTARPMPAEMSTAPRTSSFAGWRFSAGLAISVRATAAIATGMLTQKIARQLMAVR